jgi:hypothetical protein
MQRDTNKHVNAGIDSQKNKNKIRITFALYSRMDIGHQGILNTPIKPVLEVQRTEQSHIQTPRKENEIPNIQRSKLTVCSVIPYDELVSTSLIVR